MAVTAHIQKLGHVWVRTHVHVHAQTLSTAPVQYVRKNFIDPQKVKSGFAVADQAEYD